MRQRSLGTARSTWTNHLLPLLMAAFVASLAGSPSSAISGRDTDLKRRLPDMPVAITSFGAALVERQLFVFGGHTGRAHQHSFDNLSQLFLSLDLDEPEKGWRALPPGPALQGTALAEHGGNLYRVGGLRAINPRGAEEDLHSVTSVERFDPTSNVWTDLPALPAGRSSHDVAVLGNQLLVVGGWEMRGRDAEPTWASDVLALDLAQWGTQSEGQAWRVATRLPKVRRAITAVAHEGKLWVLGGLSDEGTLSTVETWDPTTDRWSQAEDLPPAGRMRGFAADALSVGGHLVVTQSDGKVHRMEPDGHWREVGRLGGSRFFHQLLATDDELIALGGANRSGHLADLETVAFSQLGLSEPSKNESARSSWPSFRNNATSAFPGQLPVEWTAQSLAWSQDLVGFGQSSPVIRDAVAYVTSVSGDQKETIWLTALSLEHGGELWQKNWPASETMESGEMVSRAAPTPAIDEQGLVLLYGSGDLFATNLEGDRVWHRNLVADYGTFTGNHGVANSVVLAGDKAIVLLARKTYSYLLAVDRSTGETIWKTDRAAGVSWATPVLSPEGTEVVVSSNGSVDSYAVGSGEKLWWIPEVTSNTTQSPTVTADLVLVAGSDAAANFALPRHGLEGEVSAESVLWRAEATSNFGSPVISDRCAYWVNKAGVAHCVDPETGATRWKHRLAESIWATPILADDKVYFFGEGGTTTILADSADAPIVVAINELELDSQLNAAAAADQTLLLRSGTRLFAIR